MDSGDIIYLVLAIIFSLVGALGKKKNKSSGAKPGILEQLFSGGNTVDDPIAEQMKYQDQDSELDMQYSDSFDFDFESEEKQVESVPLNFAEEVQKRKDENNSVFEKVEVKNQKKKDPHPIIEDLKSPDEVRRAVIYSEILKPKF